MEAKRAESKYAVIKKQLYLIQSIEPESKTKSYNSGQSFLIKLFASLAVKV